MVRFGLVGAGHMNHTYARCLLQYNRGARLLAVAGGSRSTEFAAGYGIDAEPDVNSLLSRDDIDAVIIAAPHQVLAEHSIAAARKGKHVLVENPMATRLADCDAMIGASRRAGPGAASESSSPCDFEASSPGPTGFWRRARWVRSG